jgi:glucose-1-phosphate cytidylyltransferase
MKVVLFCGGQGLRMRDAGNGPKPLVTLGERPLIWHLMKYYAHWGHTDFILCLGYKGAAIKEYFVRYNEWVSNDFTLSGGGRELTLGRRDLDDWRITFVDTGQNATIGERLLAVRRHVENEQMFLANYSDGLSDCPLPDIIGRLRETKSTAICMTAPSPSSLHFVRHANGIVTDMVDAAKTGAWINAGYFVFRPEIYDVLHPGEELVVEPFERLIAARKLAAFPYSGFWRCCDTAKDLQTLEDLMADGPAPWEVWREPAVGREIAAQERSNMIRLPARLGR